MEPLPLDQVLTGDCVELLQALPAESVDVIFADPPYNLQLRHDLWRPNQTRVDPVDDDWDRFATFADYDSFTRRWLGACRRVLKRSGTLWVIGTYHNIFRVGAILQDLDFWILNEINWIKANPMPNFKGMRFTNAHETLIWAQKERGAQYTFNHQAMRALNEDLQMRSDWYLPLCGGKERLRENGAKAHATQKPEALLYRVLISSSNPGDVVLDPFFGTGTTGVVAKRLCRRWIGMERDPKYVALAEQRLAAVQTGDPAAFKLVHPRRERRIPFGSLLEYGLLQPGETLTLGPQEEISARVMADGQLEINGQRGSIHRMAAMLHPGPCNGWELWHYWDAQAQQRRPIHVLREQLRAQWNALSDEESEP
jgi:modification methylase